MEHKIFKDRDRLTALAVRMQRGDRRAAAALYDELLPKAYGFFFSRTSKKETAEDLAQELFLKLVEKIGYFDQARGRFVVWFWQMARNLLIDHYREKKETPFSAFEETEVEMMAVTAATEAENMDIRIRYEHVARFLATLGDDEKELFELRYVAEMPYRDIADVLGKSEGALRVAAMRVKEKIKKAFHHEIEFS